MSVGRVRHTATLLPSGKVLIVGGSDACFPLAIAEQYDPGAGTFTASGHMTVERDGHTVSGQMASPVTDSLYLSAMLPSDFSIVGSFS